MIGIGFALCCITAMAGLFEHSKSPYSDNTQAALGFNGMLGIALVLSGTTKWLWENMP